MTAQQHFTVFTYAVLFLLGMLAAVWLYEPKREITVAHPVYMVDEPADCPPDWIIQCNSFGCFCEGPQQ